ncbi:OPT oligopeptide transporter protein-domain-containing protein [Catenaria anguillulae PL171]|uniref:OPT oligopeptide transporter protein-domain-containing protein n=1 Tax=Catenaria anguillulae PL171 TaxID=765915 RepID=A0A1Y2HCV4_9FUNG|nr:OPT oligopeptide transporter protein-domain-containing protein [Catenaria anguillulae PL171]
MTEKDIKNESEAVPGDAEKQESFVIDAEFESMVGDLVPCTDDTSIPSMTFRVWIIGMFFCCSVAFANMFLSLFRTIPAPITSFVTVLLSYPMGRIMAATLPSYKLNLFGFQLDTNPGPFSVKEHVLINVFGSTGACTIDVFYDMKLGAGWDLLFIFASATMGFGLAGICRRFLIRPSHMIWPTVLPTVALFTAFHNVDVKGNQSDGHKHMSQLKTFGLAAVAMAFWAIIGPGYMSKMLQNLPFLCWIAPKSNTFLQRLGSPKWGVGVLSISLDWTFVGSGPMAIPFWATLNNFVSWVVFAWLLVPIFWKNNLFNQGPWPKTTFLNSTHLFDGKGNRFLAPQVLNTKTRSPLFASTYFGHLASLTAAITHTCLWYGSDIAARVRNAKHDKDDIHCKLIDKYPEVPETWYYGFFVATLVLMIVVGQWGGIDLPVWATFLAVALAIVGTVPTIIIFATAGVSLGLNVISQFTIGVLVPGRPILMMAFKCVCFAVSWQCRDLLIDLKIGHYMKLVSQIAAGFVAYAGFRYWIDSDPIHKEWIVNYGQVKGIGADWGSNSINTYYSASLIWGAIGAKRFFFDTQYAPIIWGGALAGILLPIALWLGHKYIGGQWWVLAHPAILLSPNGPGSANSGYLTSFLLAIWSQWFMYRYRQAWWKRYNYVLATGLDVGASLVALVTGLSGLEFVEWYLNCPSNTKCESPHFGGQGFDDWCHVFGENKRLNT